MKNIVEIGCWKGRSTSALLRGCPGTVYAVDHWLGSPGDEDALEEKAPLAYEEFLQNVGDAPNLQVIKMDSISASRVVPDVDMVFIDGSHATEHVIADINAWKGKTRKMLCGHDIGITSVMVAVFEALGRPHHAAESIWFIKRSA